MLPCEGAVVILLDGEGLLIPVFPLLVPPLLPALVRLLAIAANVSSNPAGFDCSIVLEFVADVRLGTLTLMDDGPRLAFSFWSLFSLSRSFFPKI